MPCSVDDCTDDVVARSFCDKHWKRWRKYGDPLAGGARSGMTLRMTRGRGW